MKIVVVYSGGLDSTVLLEELFQAGHEVVAISFNYGQRHVKELAYARAYCLKLKVRHHIVDMSGLKPLLAGSSQTSDAIAVPDGHYADESMKQTVVPNRNMIMLSIAIGWAVSLQFDAVATAVHAGDHAIYPDCRPEFIAAMNAASRVANYDAIAILAPFLNRSKTDIANRGRELGVDFTQTWSCYKGLDEPCGVCGTCVERLEALAG